MENFYQIKEFLTDITKTTYLPQQYFQLADDVLSRAVKTFEHDYARWYPDGKFSIDNLYLTPQLIAILCYRISREEFLKRQNTYSQYGKATMSADAYSILGRQIGLIEIYYSADIGPGFKINHGIGTIIGARCKIGSNCTVHQGCTVGDRKGGRPVIGDNVIIYADSLIIGNIYIGDNSIIGANSVVTKSFPSHTILVGSPAIKINNYAS